MCSVGAGGRSPDGRSIAFLAKDGDADSDAPKVADADSELERLWVLDAAAKTARQIGTAGYRIDEFRWQDASHILIQASASPGVEEYTDAIYSVALVDGAVRRMSQPPQPFDSLLMSPDGAHFAVRSTRGNGPIPRDLFLGQVAQADLHDISAPADLAVLSAQWHDPTAIWALLDDGFYRRLYRFSLGGPPKQIDLPLSVVAFDIAHNGSIAFAGEDFDHPQEIYLREPGGRIRQLTHMQGIANTRLAPTTIFKTKSFDGVEIEAALVKPPAPLRQRKMPLVLLVHGGPAANFTTGYSWETAWAQMLATHGYEVLTVNPRGSNGYSEEFVKGNRADLGGGDYKDLMADRKSVV